MEYQSGKWLVLCDRCGFKRLAPDEVVKQEWNGLVVCAPHIKDCYEPRHEQDFLRGTTDKVEVPFVRPQPTDTFVTVTPATGGVQETTIPTGTFTTNNSTL